MCRHWSGDMGDYDKPGRCTFPLPEWLVKMMTRTEQENVSRNVTQMGYYHGQDCATFAERL